MALTIPKIALISQYLKSLNFLSQNIALPLFERLLAGTEQLPKPELEKLKIVLTQLNLLIQQDYQENGHLLSTNDSLGNLKPLIKINKFFDVIRDGLAVSQRRTQKNHKDFKEISPQLLESTPEYFQRNFHFQTDGYFSKSSANRYDHQVEILFAGGTNPMRRLILNPLKNHPHPIKRILEIGAGTGGLTQWLHKAFPEAHITCIDLSAPYLWKARQNLKNTLSIDFLTGDGAHYAFEPESFDAVVSCFLFHELPLEVRKKVLENSLRALKPQGFLGLVDSIQYGDQPDLNWALDEFPQRFHEPFYKNYAQTPMEKLFANYPLQDISSRSCYFSKAVWGTKSTKS